MRTQSIGKAALLLGAALFFTGCTDEESKALGDLLAMAFMVTPLLLVFGILSLVFAAIFERREGKHHPASLILVILNCCFSLFYAINVVSVLSRLTPGADGFFNPFTVWLFSPVIIAIISLVVLLTKKDRAPRMYMDEDPRYRPRQNDPLDDRFPRS